MTFKSLTQNFFAVACGLLLLLVIELSLWLGNVTPLAEQDPFVGFSGTSSLFIEETPGQFVVNPVKAAYFNTAQSFSLPKPAGTFRIVVLGGSTTYGRPYRQQTSFGAWLKKLIEHSVPNMKVEVLNAGGISYASYRVRRLMTEMAEYDPDLFVVYSGHNEFLEARTFADLRKEPPVLNWLRGQAQRSRIYTLLATALGKAGQKIAVKTNLGETVDATLERIGGPELYHRDAAFRAGVIRQYRYEIGEMIAFCQQKKIPLILATLPVNLASLSPFKSQHSERLTAADLKQWQAAFERGREALNQGQPQTALEAFASAEALDSVYAELYYLKGQAYLALGENILAYQAFDRARQEDIVPLRALNEINASVRELAAEARVPVADVEKMFLRVSPDHIPGATLFVDHVHPTIEGQQLVAWSVLNAATKAELVPLTASRWQQLMPEARELLRRELLNIPEMYQAQGLWSVGRLFFWAGKYPEAYTPLRQAWQSIKNEPELARQLGELELVRGDIAAALTTLDAAEKLAPQDFKITLAKAAALNRSGRADEALAALQKVTLPTNDKAAGVYHLRGETLMLLQRPLEAAENYRLATETAPAVANYWLAMAQAYKAASELEQAGSAYRGYLERLPNPAVATPLAQWLGEN